MADLAQQIRERLDGWAPPGEWVKQFTWPDGELPTPDETANFAEALSDAIDAGKFDGPVCILPPSPKVYPGFEQMRDALLRVLDGADADAEWVLHAVAQGLGIEVADA